MGTAAIVGGSIAAAGIGAVGSTVAAGTQASAAKSAAQLQYEESQQALDFQKQQFQTQQANQAPFIKAGQTAVNQLASYAPFQNPVGTITPFQAPSYQQAAQDPGYQFALAEGERAIGAGASATGNVFSGTTLNAADQYAQGLAANQYGNVYSRALSAYNTNLNTQLQNYNLAANTYGTNLNRLQALAGEGQTAIGQIGQTGQAAAQNVGNISMTAGQQIGQNINNAAAAEASGYVGAANTFSGATNNLAQYAMLQSILNPASSTAGLYSDYGASPWIGSGATSPYTGPITADPSILQGIVP